mgnify:CR=1 FL=1
MKAESLAASKGSAAAEEERARGVVQRAPVRAGLAEPERRDAVLEHRVDARAVRRSRRVDDVDEPERRGHEPRRAHRSSIASSPRTSPTRPPIPRTARTTPGR